MSGWYNAQNNSIVTFMLRSRSSVSFFLYLELFEARLYVLVYNQRLEKKKMISRVDSVQLVLSFELDIRFKYSFPNARNMKTSRRKY